MSYNWTDGIANCTAKLFDRGWWDYRYSSLDKGKETSPLLITAQTVGLTAAVVIFALNGCCYGCFKPKKPIRQVGEGSPLVDNNRPQTNNTSRVFWGVTKALVVTGAVVATSVLTAKAIGWLGVHDLHNTVLETVRLFNASYSNCTGGGL